MVRVLVKSALNTTVHTGMLSSSASSKPHMVALTLGVEAAHFSLSSESSSST